MNVSIAIVIPPVPPEGPPRYRCIRYRASSHQYPGRYRPPAAPGSFVTGDPASPLLLAVARPASGEQAGLPDLLSLAGPLHAQGEVGLSVVVHLRVEHLVLEEGRGLRLEEDVRSGGVDDLVVLAR